MLEIGQEVRADRDPGTGKYRCRHVRNFSDGISTIGDSAHSLRMCAQHSSLLQHPDRQRTQPRTASSMRRCGVTWTFEGGGGLWGRGLHRLLLWCRRSTTRERGRLCGRTRSRAGDRCRSAPLAARCLDLGGGGGGPAKG